MADLERRTFARAGFDVSALGLGTAPAGDLYARLDEGEAVGTIVSALEDGITLVDTSPHYGNGLAELRIGAALRAFKGARPVISTKIGRVMNPFEGQGNKSNFAGGVPHTPRFDYSYDGVMRSLEHSMLRLGIDRIDIALIHDVDVWTHGPDAVGARVREVLDGAYPTLEKLRGQGVIRSIGFGINESDTATMFAEKTDVDSFLLAGRYSLLEQPALADFLPVAERKKIAVMLGGVYNSGILATGAVPGAKYNYNPASDAVLARVKAIEAVCRRHDTPLRIAALHFALAHPAVASVVLGAVSASEVRSNVEAVKFIVPSALWAELKAEELLDLAAPTP